MASVQLVKQPCFKYTFLTLLSCPYSSQVQESAIDSHYGACRLTCVGNAWWSNVPITCMFGDFRVMSVLNSVDVCLQFSNRTGLVLPQYYIIVWNILSISAFSFSSFLSYRVGSVCHKMHFSIMKEQFL